MSGDDLDLLIHRYFEKSISPEDEERLWSIVRSDPAAADRFVELSEVESGLVESFKAEAELPVEVRPPGRTSRRHLRASGGRPERLFTATFMIAAGVFAAIILIAVIAVPGGEPPTGARLPRVAEPPGPSQPPQDFPVEQWREALARAQERMDLIEKERRLLETQLKDEQGRTPEAQQRVEQALARNETERKAQAAQVEKIRAAAPTVTQTAAAILDGIEGEAFVVRGGARTAAKSGGSLLAGDALETSGVRSAAGIRFEDGTRFELKGDSGVRDLKAAGGKGMTVTRGTLTAVVTRQPANEPAVVRTPHAEVRVIGTRFTVALAADFTRVDVEEGRVRLRRLSDGVSAEIAAGHFAQAGKGIAPAAKPVPQVRSFQDGVAPTADYTGTRDTTISMKAPTLTHGAGPMLGLHKANDNQLKPLIKWDLTSIPPGSRIVSAEVTFWVTGAQEGHRYNAYEVRRFWEESEATWKTAAGAVAWQTPGAQADLDRGSKILATLTPARYGLYTFPLNEDGLAVVHRWINAPATNHGLLFTQVALTNAWEFNSRESTPAEHRPKLKLTYLPPSGR